MITLTCNPPPPAGHHEIERLIPTGSPWAFLEWPMPPEESGGPILKPTMDAICKALLASGSLAFRWDEDEDPPPGEHRFFPPPPRPLLARMTGGILPLDHDDNAYGVLTTPDPQVAPALFEWSGWIWAGQAVLVFDPASADIDAVVETVRHGLDWSRRSWLPGVRLLFGPGHDGDFAAVSAVDQVALDTFVADLKANAGDGFMIQGS
jgi:hypothetical protein